MEDAVKVVPNIIAKNGFIYEWKHDDKTRYCVVVSAGNSIMSDLVSVLFLKPYAGVGADVIKVSCNNKTWCVRADLVTYTPREYFTKQISKISDDARKKIKARIAVNFGLLDRKEVSYEDMYNDLIKMIISQKELNNVHIAGYQI